MTAISAGIGATVMIACTGLGAIVGAIQPGAGLALFAVLAVAV